MLVYYFVPFIVSNRYLLCWDSNGHNSITVQNRTHVYMNFFHHKDLGNHLLQLCPKVVKHSVCMHVFLYVCMYVYMYVLVCMYVYVCVCGCMNKCVYVRMCYAKVRERVELCFYSTTGASGPVIGWNWPLTSCMLFYVFRMYVFFIYLSMLHYCEIILHALKVLVT